MCLYDVYGCFLHKLVLTPSRNAVGQRANVFDLVLTSHIYPISNLSTHSRIGKGYHSVITFDLNCNFHTCAAKTARYVYNKENDYDMNYNLNTSLIVQTSPNVE